MSECNFILGRFFFYLMDHIWYVKIFGYWIYIGVFTSYSIHFFKFWYLCFGNISVLLNFLPFSFQAIPKVSYCLPRYQNVLVGKELCYLRNIKLMSVVESWGRRKDEYHDHFHFLCNLKRYVFVQVYNQRLIFILKPCRSPTENLLRKFL